ncbi:MAG: hypothetical protein IKT52_13350 [Oscillospiraceae bacterium]|nr:hypothetical protein [Oscillospiraceae bacterium]
MTQEEITISRDRMRFTKDTLSANAVIAAIVLDCLYFVSIYQSDVSTWYYNWVIGASIICNLLFLLIAFLASEGVKSRKTGFTVPLIALGLFQIIRIFYLPAKAHAATVVIAGAEQTVMGNGQYFYTVICLALSAVCCIFAAVNSSNNNKKLAAHMQTIENKTA